MLQRTPLYEMHASAGARLVDFAGWEMPVQYGSILDEVRAVRGAAGLFDVSHMGEIRVTGSGALASLQRLLTNDVAKLLPGRAQYSLMCRPDGGILDDLIVYRWDGGAADPDYLIVVNASNREADYAWMCEHGATADAIYTDVSDTYALIALQGPRAQALLDPCMASGELSDLRPFSHRAARFTGGGTQVSVHVARTGYTGEDGFELFCPWDEAPIVWSTLVNAGAAVCGLGARDVLRIEASYPLYGHEISTETIPYEAGLGWVVKPAKGDFIGRDAMVSAKEAGLKRHLRGVIPDDKRAIPRQGTVVGTPGGQGVVTSGTFSPTMERAIGMAYVPVGAEGPVTLAMRGKEMPAGIVNLPFYKRG